MPFLRPGFPLGCFSHSQLTAFRNVLRYTKDDLRKSVKCWLSKLSFFRMNCFTDVTERQSHCYLTRLKKFNLSDSIEANSCPFFTVYIFVLKRDIMLFTRKEDKMTFLEAKKDIRDIITYLLTFLPDSFFFLEIGWEYFLRQNNNRQ